ISSISISLFSIVIVILEDLLVDDRPLCIASSNACSSVGNLNSCKSFNSCRALSTITLAFRWYSTNEYICLS
ncbi:14865_t:CDS:1, partial [Cetraspora pellucida]